MEEEAEKEESILLLRKLVLVRVIEVSFTVSTRSTGVTPTPTSTIITPLLSPLALVLVLASGLSLLALVFVLVGLEVGSLLVDGEKPKPIAGIKGEREKEKGEVEVERADDEDEEDDEEDDEELDGDDDADDDEE